MIDLEIVFQSTTEKNCSPNIIPLENGMYETQDPVQKKRRDAFQNHEL